MYPQTQALIEALRDDNDAPMIAADRAERPDTTDPRVLQLVLKKRYQTNLLRRMLENAGYGDLAKMTSFRRERLEDDEDGN